MKVSLNPIIEKLSGKIKGIIFVSKNKRLVGDDSKLSTEVYIRSSYNKQKPNSIKQDNINKAFKIMVTAFNQLKANKPAYETWIKEAKTLETQMNRTVTAYLLFTTFFMTKYTHTLGQEVEPINLSSGLSLSYNDCNTRSWNKNHLSGYGTGTYGTGAFGV